MVYGVYSYSTSIIRNPNKLFPNSAIFFVLTEVKELKDKIRRFIKVDSRDLANRLNGEKVQKITASIERAKLVLPKSTTTRGAGGMMKAPGRGYDYQ